MSSNFIRIFLKKNTDLNQVETKLSNNLDSNLVLEIDDFGILKKKNFYNKDDMEELKIAKETTEAGFKKNSFIYEFMSSMRQKINDPLGQRAKKAEEIKQR